MHKLTSQTQQNSSINYSFPTPHFKHHQINNNLQFHSSLSSQQITIYLFLVFLFIHSNNITLGRPNFNVQLLFRHLQPHIMTQFLQLFLEHIEMPPIMLQVYCYKWSFRALNIISAAQPTLFLMRLGDKIQQFSLQIRREDRAFKIKTIREGLVESILIRQSSGCPFCGTSIVIDLLQCFRTQHICSCHLSSLTLKTAEVLQLQPHLIRQYFRTHSNSSVLQRCLVLFIAIIEKGFFDQYPLWVCCLTEQSLLRDAMSMGFSLKELDEDDYSLVEISLLKELAKQACILFVSRHPFLYLQIAEQYPFQCLMHHIRCKSTQLALMDILTPLSFQTGNHEVLRDIFSWVQTEVSLSKSEKDVSRVVSLFLVFVEYGSPEILGIEGVMCASILAYGVEGHAFNKLRSIVEFREWPLNRENQERIMDFLENHDGLNSMMAEQNWRI